MLLAFGCRPEYVDLSLLFAHESCERLLNVVQPNFFRRLRRRIDGPALEDPEAMYSRFTELVVPTLVHVIGKDLGNIFDGRQSGSTLQIFIWAVISSHVDLAVAIWESCENPVHLALKATALVRKVHTLTIT